MATLRITNAPKTINVFFKKNLTKLWGRPCWYTCLGKRGWCKVLACFIHYMAQLVVPVPLVTMLWITTCTYDTPRFMFLSFVSCILCLEYKSLCLICILTCDMWLMTHTCIMIYCSYYKWIMFPLLVLCTTSFHGPRACSRAFSPCGLDSKDIYK
jgi:hypothetical protein